MNWLARLSGHSCSSTTINVSGKAIDVFCSARANQALARRERPLVAELELAFACMARKQVRFHDTPREGDVIGVTERLGLLITAVVPSGCGVADAKTAAKATARNFVPRWVRIDHAKGEWVGEYGL